MAETPASPVPEPSTGVPADLSASTDPVEAAGSDGPAVEASAEAAATAPAQEAPPLPEVPPAIEAPGPAAPPAAEPPPLAPPAARAPAPVVETARVPAPVVETVVEAVAVMEVVVQTVEAEASGDADAPRVATTLEVPPLPGGGAGPGSEGGEWELLLGKVGAWLEQADLPGQWNRLSGPLRGVGILLGILLVLKLYGALLASLDDLPLLPRLLQLVGLIALLRFSLTRLTRSSDRKVILNDWKRRWDAFSGS